MNHSSFSSQGHTAPPTATNEARMRCSGYTLLEVIIASALMFSLVASLLSAWAATMDFSFMVNENLKRMEAVDNVRMNIQADFDQSAQFVQYDSTVMVAAINATTNENVTLYPSILQSGREVQFVRFRTSLTAATNPFNQSQNMENLIGTNGQALSQYALAPVSPYFIINPNGGLPGYWNLSPVWDSDRTQLTFNENADPVNLRIYRYILIPYSNVVPATIAVGLTYSISDYPSYPEAGPTLFRGMLIRQYRNAAATTWQTIGIPLSDAVVFDTINDENSTTLPCFIFASAFDGIARTGTESIGDNEVRMKLSLAMQTQKITAPVLIDFRFSFPFRRIDFGE